MRITTVLAAMASLLSVATEALVSQQRDRSAPKVVGLGIERRPSANPLHRDVLRRRGSVEVGLDNEETLYFINASIGTPPRPVRLHIDTGSSDLWVNTPSSKLCEESSSPCRFAGTYTANSSSTYKYIGSWFNISYVDGSGASGDYVSDVVKVGDAKLNRLQFGIGYSSSNSQGILGIGYVANEVQFNRAGKSPYNNLPAQMVQDGMIQSNAYSLWLNDLDANTGNILFGGVDTEKYTGSLQTLPIQNGGGAFFAEFLITMTGLKYGNTTIADDLSLGVLLDTGSSLTYLPDDMVSQIYNQLDAQYDSSAGVAYVPCSEAHDDPNNLEFTFSGVKIVVDMDELVLDLVTSSGNPPTFQNGVKACLFGIAPAGSNTNVLGDTFLRSAYVVYDMDNNQISLAQTRFNTTASNIVEIGKGKDAVPDATLVANPVAATEGVTPHGGIIGGGSGGGIGLNSSASGFGSREKIGAVFGVAVSVALGAAGFLSLV